MPAGITADAASSLGAAVAYSVLATDNFDTSPSINCSPASGSTFSVGDTTVMCSASDKAGNTSDNSFNVHVRSVSEQLIGLGSLIDSFNLPQGTVNSLKGKLLEAQQAINDGNTGAACSSLTDFVSLINAQAGKKITAPQANQLISAATQIKGRFRLSVSSLTRKSLLTGGPKFGTLTPS